MSVLSESPVQIFLAPVFELIKAIRSDYLWGLQSPSLVSTATVEVRVYFTMVMSLSA